MNAAHVHLLVNHISLFGVLIGLVALVWSLLRNNRDMRWSSVLLFVISGIFSLIAMNSGEGAEEIVEHLPGVVESLIENHEEAAESANILVLALAVASLAMEALARFKDKYLKPAQVAVVLIAVVASAFLARTAQLGGFIRHTEIQAAVTGEGDAGGDSASHD